MKYSGMGGLLHKIDRYGLCLGCGMCESVFGSEKCRMEQGADGYFHPLASLDGKDSAVLAQICPGIREQADCGGQVWGRVESVAQAWATDEALRYKAASGGAVSATLIYALESGIVDAVLQVGSSDGLDNELKVSRTKEQIMSNAGSRYAPAVLFRDIKKLLESSDERYAFVGKPCDLAALRNFMGVFPQFAGRFPVKMAVFCAGIPSHLASRQLAEKAGRGQAKSIVFRGNGWPGKFVATFSDGTSFSMSYEDSWGAHLGRNLETRCKICPDGIGLLADLSFADSWNLKDGKPDFTEDEGRSLCIVRTENGRNILNGAVQAGLVHTSPWTLDKLALQQPYQYRRRLMCRERMLPLRFLFGRDFRMSGMDISFSPNMKPALCDRLKELRGSARRLGRKLLKK